MYGQILKKKQAFNFLSTLITSTSRFGTESQSPTQQLPSVSRVHTELEVSALQEAIAESQTFGCSNFTCHYLRKSFYRLFWSFFFFQPVVSHSVRGQNPKYTNPSSLNVSVTATVNAFDSKSTILPKDGATMSHRISVIEYRPGGLACYVTTVDKVKFTARK